ncbi:hypothetical protein ABW19_dt0200153 [Dactylella cylindrospora]|nr:hypothetical protein ABW19_dt0200153 [Dactylella cylindrospora]
MPWLRTHLKTLFSSKKPKNPPKLDKGKGRAHPPDLSYSPDPDSYSPSPHSRTGSGSSSPLSDVTDSDLIPIIHYSELHLVPQVLTKFPAFYLVGHPLPPPPLDQAKQLLTSPESVKQTLIHPRNSTVRGYNNAKGSGREWWDYTPEEGGTKLTLDDEEFRRATKEYFDKGLQILQEVCKQFNESEGREVIPNPIIEGQGFSTMRYLRYSPEVFGNPETPPSAPPSEPTPATSTPGKAAMPASELKIERSSSNKKDSNGTGGSRSSSRSNGRSVPRMEAHTDHGVLTLMTSTEPSGLYVWDRHGRIFSAPPIENTVLIIAGDLMAHFTAIDGKSPLEGEGAIGENTVLPTVHAVVIPKGKGERYSVAVFLRPERKLVVSKLPEKKIVDCGKVETLDEMTFGRWAEEKGKIRGRRCWMIGQKDLGEASEEE